MEVCAFYRTRGGCKRGKKCAKLHIDKNGRVKNPKPSRDSCKMKIRKALMQVLREAGSETQLGRLDFDTLSLGSREDSIVQVQCQGKAACLAALNAARTNFVDGVAENRLFGVSGTSVPENLYHRTTIAAGINILVEGRVRNSEHCHPAGVYTCADMSGSFYDQGAVVVIRPIGFLASKRASKQIDDKIPPGVVVVKERSVKEFVLDESSHQVISVWFVVDQLLQWFRETGVAEIEAEIGAQRVSAGSVDI